jgi:hypothetical protein
VGPAEPFLVRLSDQRTAVAVRATGPDDLSRAVGALRLPGPCPVVAVIGGAAGLDGELLDRLGAVFAGTIAPAIRGHGAIAVDGGTDSGVMRLLGRARAAGDAFPLVGVAAIDTVRFPGHQGSNPDAAGLEPNHSHFVFVPGDHWGDEATPLARVASALAGDHPSVTILINGGEIALDDATRSIAERRPLLVLAGTGRTADRIAAAAATPAAHHDTRAVEIARSSLVRIIPVTDPTTAAAALNASLTR